MTQDSSLTAESDITGFQVEGILNDEVVAVYLRVPCNEADGYADVMFEVQIPLVVGNPERLDTHAVSLTVESARRLLAKLKKLLGPG